MNPMRKYGLWIALLATAVMIAGCGIKPNHLDQPPGTEPNEFPRDYPQPERP